MLRTLFLTVALTAGGVGAGVLTAVAISVFPALCAMTPARYADTHRLLGKGFHPTMPIVFNVAMLAAIGAAVLTPWPLAWLPIAAAVLLAGSQTVSHLGNVPINRTLAGAETAIAEGRWIDPRPRWKTFNVVRTSLSVSALALLAVTASV